MNVNMIFDIVMMTILFFAVGKVSVKVGLIDETLWHTIIACIVICAVLALAIVIAFAYSLAKISL